MADQVSVNWLTCDEDGCIGIRLDAGDKCLAHVGDEEQDAALKQVAQTGKIDARGVTISSTLFKKILDSAPRNPDGHAMLTEVQFDRATFQGMTSQRIAGFMEVIFQGIALFSGATFQDAAWFARATFQGDTRFTGAIFKGAAWFNDTTFQGDAWFNEATFQDFAWFNKAIFQGDARFDEATFQAAQFNDATFQGMAFFPGATFLGASFRGPTFQDNAWFNEATFQGDARFSEAIFQGDAGFTGATFQDKAWFGEAKFQAAWFQGATFQGAAWFSDTTFQGDARFYKATFQGDAWFDNATFHGDAWFPGTTFRRDVGFPWVTFKSIAEFRGAAFERAQQLGPLLAHQGLNLDVVRFDQSVQIEASTIGICCRQAQFPGGVQFRLRWADVVLDDTDIPAPSLLTGIPGPTSEELALVEQQIVRGWKQEHADRVSEQPRLLSLQRANVAGLGLANVDLASCRFSGAHNLDKLRLEADVVFEPSPARVGWEQRQVIAEECTWRASQSRSGRWADPWWPDGSDPWWREDFERPRALAPEGLAGLYRALRKSREDAKDEPGAADFYYGEMEMRRHAHGRVDRGHGGSRGRVDRSVLTAYWLVSGYGLRAWRALAWLAGITAAFALAFHLVGFTHPPLPASYWTSLLYAFRSTISLTDNEVTLTAWGQLLQALLRLTGPVLLGLALLALRGHVKR